MGESQAEALSKSWPDMKAHNVFERDKEEFEEILHMEAQPHNHHKETHGLRDDIDENTPIKDVKAPNVFERAKEEIEALAQTIHSKKGTKSHGSPSNGKIRDAAVELKPEKPDTRSGISAMPLFNLFVVGACHVLYHYSKTASTLAEKDVKAPNLIQRAKEGMEAMMHKEKSPHRHHKETHGMSEDINENTSTSEIKGPNVFERAKEEIEALIQTIHPKKQSDNVVSPTKKEDGFRISLGKGLAKVCSPRGHKRD
ncbi:hypothetical protein RJ639_008374 [Escallonia herrerae]|uniref:Uncharacterized protein n=1 Tax=Escallonia herrerae TaxID=1293975 RepID=A0AA88VW53_9ASTE|nr:hypothetical protein RJ639_008374 [Escallonia herrerae]